tara:strand:- start:111 stop:665 length:555 start_codon:yes stop_codon:yes gene_type:complete
MKTTIDNKVFDLCREIIEDGKLTENEVYDLSNFINKQIDDCDDGTCKWPNNLLIKPLQEVWQDGALDSKELNVLAELLVSIVYNSELENNKSTNTTKTCPHCSRVLMSTIIPRCSWCGEDLKQEEMYVPSEDWLNSKKIEDAWDDVLSEKQMSCFHNWFGRLYECPVDKYNEMRRRYGESHSDW